MNTKTMSIISLVCGIVGLVGGSLTGVPVLGFIIPLCPIAGIVFGAINCPETTSRLPICIFRCPTAWRQNSACSAPVHLSIETCQT